MVDESPLTWRPLGVRDTAGVQEYDVLVEGIPEWLRMSLWRWAMDRAAEDYPENAYRAERVLRIELPMRNGENAFIDYWSGASDDEKLALLDFFMHLLEEAYDEGHQPWAPPVDTEQVEGLAHRLDWLLTEGGSVWRVQFKPFWGLARRVDEATQALVESVSAPDSDAARKIASAWASCYRREPDYDKAYREAVLAVEALTLPVALPDATTGTLGNVVAHVSDTVGRWSVAGLDDKKQASGETLLAMLRTLWHNQERHAQRDGTIRDVGQAEAEAAVSLAVTLVHWFSTGLVSRAPKSGNSAGASDPT